jgi:hypothetical protein
MPELRIKDVRIPELNLPEMTLDDIARAIGEATRDVDLSRLDPRKMDLPDMSDIARELSKVDVPAALATVATIRRASRPARVPFILGGLVVLGIATVAIARSPMVRPKLESFAQRAREEFESRRAARAERVAAEHELWRSLDTPTASPESVTTRVEESIPA